MMVVRWFGRAASRLSRARRAGAFSTALLLASTAFAANTVQNFDAVFPPGGGGNAPALQPFGSIAIIDGWDGKALRLTTEDNSLNTGVALNQMVAGNYSELRVDFEMSFSPGNGGGADGIGFAYANTSIFGADNTSTFPGWGTSEEPNLSGSLGVGFDTFNNADQGDGGESSVSVHFDNARLDSVTIDDSDIGSFETGSPILASMTIKPVAGGSNFSLTLLDLDTGNTAVPYEDYFISGFSPYDGRPVFKGRTGGANSEQSIDNLKIDLTPAGGGAVQSASEDFESYDLGDITAPPLPPNPPLVGGTPFTEFQGGSDPPVRIKNLTSNSGAQPGYMQMSDNVGSQVNSIAFDKTSDVADNIEATFKFKINDSGNNADGMAFLILDTDQYGDDGELTGGFSEEPNLAGALGVGFDTFDNDEEGVDGDPAGCGGAGTCGDRLANHFSLHWNGAKVGENVLLDQGEFSLVNGEWNEASVIATQVDGGMNVTLVVTDGADGSVHVVFADQFIEGAEFPNGARAAFGARTGGAASIQSIDDVNISWTGGGGILGDFNGNGSLDVGDIDDLTSKVAAGGNQAAYDLNSDNAVNFGDISIWIKDLKNSWFGDANLDGEFNSGDLVTLFIAGTYEDASKAAVWSTGDFNGDGLFTTSDLVTALGDGGYEAGPRAAVAAVPEPSSLVLLALGSLLVVRRRK